MGDFSAARGWNRGKRMSGDIATSHFPVPGWDLIPKALAPPSSRVLLGLGVLLGLPRHWVLVL